MTLKHMSEEKKSFYDLLSSYKKKFWLVSAIELFDSWTLHVLFTGITAFAIFIRCFTFFALLKPLNRFMELKTI